MRLRRWIAKARRRHAVAVAVLVPLLTVASLSLSGGVDFDELASAAGRPIGRGEIQRITFADSLVFAYEWTIPGEQHSPSDVAADDSHVYVAVPGHIKKFTVRGEFVAEIYTQCGTPVGIAVDKRGNTFVTHEELYQYPDAACRKLEKYDARGQRVRQWLNESDREHFPISPAGVATDEDGNVYVVDVGARDVKKFNAAGAFLVRWTPQQDQSGNWPVRVATDKFGKVYVGNGPSAGRQVQVYERGGGWLQKWEHVFSHVGAIASDSLGRLYVADVGRYKVSAFTKSGQLIAEWGHETGTGPWVPDGIAVDGSGDIYVVDDAIARVAKFRFGLPDRKLGEADFEVSATASSGLPITFSAKGFCAIRNGTWVHLTGPGRCTVIASQKGNSRYAPAQFSRSFDVR